MSKKRAQQKQKRKAISSLPIPQTTLLRSFSSLSTHPPSEPLSFSDTLLLALVKQIGTVDGSLKTLEDKNRGQLGMLKRIFEDKEFAGVENAGLVDRCEELSKIVKGLERERKGLIEERNGLKKDVDVRIEYEQELIRKSVMRGEEMKEKTERVKGVFGKVVFGDPFRVLKERWMDDESVVECCFAGCDVGFGIVERKHHCRRCGEIFCAAHSSKTACVSLLDYSLDEENGFNVRFVSL
jgi:hypothetical protein